jgi:phage gp29-like protein
MIYSLTQYAPTIQVLKSESQFKEQDKIILTGMRKVLHIPKTISGDYVRTQTDIPPTQENTLKLARNYLENENRSNEIKEYTLKHMASKNKKLRKKNPTPVDIMYPNR